MFLSIISEHIDVFVTSLHQFKHSVIIENRLLHWQPFMTHPFPFPHYCGKWPPKCCFPAKINYTCRSTISHACLWCAGLTGAFTGQFQTLSAQFSDMTHSLWHPHKPLYQLAMNFSLEAHFVCKNWITPQTSLWDQVSSIIVTWYHLAAWTAFAVCAICCLLPLQLLPPT